MKFLKTEPGERIDHPDFDEATGSGAVRRVGDQADLLVRARQDETQRAGYVLEGLEVTNPTGKVVRVGIGHGVFAALDPRTDEVVYGIPTEVTVPIDVDVTSFPNPSNNYGVWVRAELLPTDYANRRFWNAAAATPVEEIEHIPTRSEISLRVQITESTDPGASWTRIALIVPNTLNGTGAGVDDYRFFMFEGDAQTGFDPTQEWGTATDLLSTRGAVGTTISSLAKFASMVRSKLEKINGLNWWADPSVDLQYVNNNALSASGTVATSLRPRMQGHLEPTPTKTHNFGSATLAWLVGYINRLVLGQDLRGSISDSLLPRLNIDYVTAYAMRLLTSENLTSLADSKLSVYRMAIGLGTESNALTLAFNAEWDGSVWSAPDSGYQSLAVSVNSRSFRVFYRPANPGTWSMALGPGEWEETLQLDRLNGLRVQAAPAYANNFQFNTTQTFQWACPLFMPAEDNNSVVTNAWTGRGTTSPGVGPFYFELLAGRADWNVAMWALRFPQGATIGSFKVTATRTGTASTFTLVRISHADGSVAAISASANPGIASPTPSQFSLTGITADPVDNGLYSYWLHTYAPTTDGLGMYAAVATIDVTEVGP